MTVGPNTCDPSEPVVVATNVGRTFHTKAESISAVDGVSFEVGNGEIVGLVGPSGSGKTTLLHLVMGWERPDAGTIALRPDVITNWTGLAIVPQGLGLLPHLTARQNVELAARLSGRTGFSQSELLTELELDAVADRIPAQLSHGEQQRVAIARAVLCQPLLLVADEPTAHQDEARADIVMSIFRRVADRSSSVLVTTHDERVLAGVDRVVQIVDGRLV